MCFFIFEDVKEVVMKGYDKLGIGIDIDGTLTDPGYFIPHLNEYFKKDIRTNEPHIYDYAQLYNTTPDEIRHYFTQVKPDVMFESNLLDHARETVLELSEKNRVYIITARKNELYDKTRRWLDKKGLGSIELLCLGTPDKSRVARELKVEYFLEDHPTASIEIADSGIQVYLMDAPYNKDTAHRNIERIFSWMQARDHLIKKGAL